MLTIWGSKTKQAYCDGISRRDFLTVGALGGLGLTLADLFRLKAQGALNTGSSRKSVINVILPGGPSHLDSYDLKPDAPVEIRGEFKPISTNIPGLDICDRMPEQAKIADKLAIIRNMTLVDGDAHNLHVPLTGYRKPEQRPALGSIVSRLRSDHRSGLPQYVSLVGDIHPEIVGHEQPLYAGAEHRPFVHSGPGMKNLNLARGITLGRLNDRKNLLKAFDSLRSDIDAT